MALLRAIIILPVLLRMRARNPCRRFCTSRVAPFIVLRGPHRSWEAMPPRAGCEEMAVLGTRSAPTLEDVVAPVEAGVGRKEVGVREGVRLGRSGVKIVEKALVAEGRSARSAGRSASRAATFIVETT